MTVPRLEACYFGPGVDQRWDRMARVLRFTAATHCPNWTVNVVYTQPKLVERGTRAQAFNTAKLERWCELVTSAPDGQRMLLIDADTFIVRSLDQVWDRTFDLAYTTKTHQFPFNAGVIFLRVSDPVRAFMRAWMAENARLLEGADQPQLWKQQFGGVNQGALGHVLATDHGLTLATLACVEWNCEDSAWASFDPSVTRIVHVKSALRMACIESQPIPPELTALAARWKACAIGRPTMDSVTAVRTTP